MFLIWCGSISFFLQEKTWPRFFLAGMGEKQLVWAWRVSLKPPSGADVAVPVWDICSSVTIHPSAAFALNGRSASSCILSMICCWQSQSRLFSSRPLWCWINDIFPKLPTFGVLLPTACGPLILITSAVSSTICSIMFQRLLAIKIKNK